MTSLKTLITASALAILGSAASAQSQDLSGYYVGGSVSSLGATSFWGITPTDNVTGDFDVSGSAISLFGERN